MLRPSVIAFIVFVWVVGMIFGAVMEGQAQSGQVGTVLGTDEQNVISRLSFWNEVHSEQTWGSASFLVAGYNFFGALFDMVTLNFSFLDDVTWGALFRWIVLGPIVAMVVYGLIMSFIAIFSRNI